MKTLELGFSSACSHQEGTKTKAELHKRTMRTRLKEKAMKKYSDKSLNVPRFDPQSLNTAKPHVRYVGFEGTTGGRRLRFWVKSLGRKSVEITIEISDAAFIAGSGVSIQD